MKVLTEKEVTKLTTAIVALSQDVAPKELSEKDAHRLYGLLDKLIDTAWVGINRLETKSGVSYAYDIW